MNENIKEHYKKIFLKFVLICNENKLWYSLANDTLLSAKNGNNYFVNSGIIEVFMTQNDYNFLRLNYSNNILDFTNSDIFFLPTPFFYFKNIDIFIKIIIIIPTETKKVKKFNSLKNKIKYNYSFFLTFKSGYNILNKGLFLWLKLFSKFCIPLGNDEFYDSLFSENYRGFFAINSLNEPSVKNWFPNITFDVEEIIFLGISTKIIKEYDYFLNTRYGKEWKNGVSIKTSHFDYDKLMKNI
ncbi:MAG: hypothetical protein ACRC1F_01270 [Metamycoplasmataceae bacterium]